MGGSGSRVFSLKMSETFICLRKVVDANIFLMFIPNFGEMIQFDEHIFQMGWFNHQLD